MLMRICFITGPFLQEVPGTPEDSETGGSRSLERGVEKGTPGGFSFGETILQDCVGTPHAAHKRKGYRGTTSSRPN